MSRQGETGADGEGKGELMDWSKRLSEHGSLFLKHEELDGEDFTGLEANSLDTQGGVFRGCRFERMKIGQLWAGVGGETSLFVDCSFDRSVIQHFWGSFYRFQDCSFRGGSIKDWHCTRADVVDCVFTARLRKCIFFGHPGPSDNRPDGRRANQIEGNDFSEARLSDSDFKFGVDLRLQELPTGPEYFYFEDGAAAAARLRAALESWTDPELVADARVTLKIMDEWLDGGQEQLFYNINSYPPRDRPWLRAALEAAAG
jgi:hypothetical protein